VPLGDDFDGAVDHVYRGLIVNRVRRHWYPGGPSFYVGQRGIRQVLALKVRKQREINQPQRSVAAGERIMVATPDFGGETYDGSERALAKNLLKLWPALWTFADVPDVEPTNNAAERGLRAAVIYRKLSLGSRSRGGERTIERLLSVDQTCRLQRRSLYGYLADALTAKARGDPVPSL
jgi:Transposase IS66 family